MHLAMVAWQPGAKKDTPLLAAMARGPGEDPNTVVIESLTDDMGMRKSQVHLDMFPKEVIDDVNLLKPPAVANPQDFGADSTNRLQSKPAEAEA